MSCNWQNDDYFSLLMSTDKKAHVALEMLVDDLHGNKERTINKFLGHSGAEDFLWGLVRLLGNENSRVAGNAAYIIGTVAESDMGCSRILGLAKSQTGERRILADLTRMLTFDDSESVMNAAGTMGTLAESYEGREWMLADQCLRDTLEHITALLQAENLWTASNAALVLARLAISENGCNAILQHENSQHILSKLVHSLGVDEADYTKIANYQRRCHDLEMNLGLLETVNVTGPNNNKINKMIAYNLLAHHDPDPRSFGRGMNAAFAIGRLCDMEVGRKRLLMLSDSEKMLSSLAKMLSCDDTGASKNACFALSCLATNMEGHTRLLKNIHSDNILRTLSQLLNAEDSETGWFAAMTLRTLASQPRGCLRLRDHPQVIPALQSIDKREDVNPDLKEEASITLEILKRLEKPSPPTIEVFGHNSMKASWPPVSTKSGFQVRYQLFDTSKCVYTGKDLSCQIFGLQPCSQYTYKLRAFTEGDESPFSDTVTIVTEEAVPSAPVNVRVLGCTITQLKIGWDPPENFNGTLKGYYVYLDDKMVEHTQELTAILTGLTASTSYQVEVCAATSKGKGEKSYVVGTTSELGAHAPSKPHVNVLGRNELHITWDSPEVPLGRITRYDVLMNGKIIYSGTELGYTVRRLTPDTEYSFVIVALTSEGKFESKVTKKRTAKDEYDASRPPLYQTPVRRDSMGAESNVTQTSKKKKPPTADVKQRAVVSGKQRSLTPGNLRTRTPAEQLSLASRPVSGSSSASTVPEKELKENREIEHREPTKVPEISHQERTTTTHPDRLPTKSAPVHNVHFKENHHPVVQKSKPERSSNVNKMFPLSVSYVSIQGESSVDGQKETKKPETEKKMFYRSGTFIESSNSNSMHAMKIDRSKTLMHSGHVRRRNKVIENNCQVNPNLMGNDYVSSLLGKIIPHSNAPPSKSQEMSTHPDTVQAATENVAPQKLMENLRQPTSVTLKENVHIANEPSPVKSYKTAMTSNSNKQSENVTLYGNHKLRSTKDKFNKETFLPKPTLPSQQYLEGRSHGMASTPWGSRSLPSPRTLSLQRESESEDMQQRRSDQGSTNNLFIAEHPHDCSYFLEMQDHRTNYISVHRNSSVQPKSESKSRFSLPNIPQPGHSSRPSVRKVVQKIQQEGVPSMPVVPNAHTFNLDLPDNKSTMTTWNRTFIPMQLRTQPSNLPPSHLQRMNTTLGEQAKGVQFKRVEAMTRSKTVIDLKQNSTTLGEQVERFPLTQSANSKGRTSPGVKGSHNLMRSPSAYYKEPDSVLLKKSWSMNTSHEGTLQSAR